MGARLCFPMIRFSPISLLGILPVLALAGCGGQEKFADSNVAVNDQSRMTQGLADAQGGTVTEPESVPGKYGGSLVDAALGDPKTFNLWVSADASSSNSVGNLFSSLISRNQYTLEWESGLAELPTVSDDNLTWTFTMKPGLKWSDGAPLTVDDVMFTMDVIFDEKVQTNMREGMKVDVPDGKGGFKREPIKYQKVGPDKVAFTFPVPYAPALDIISIVPAPKHVLEAAYKQGQPGKTAFNPKWGIDTDVTKIVSSGPYVFESYVPGQRMVYKRNPNYWKKADNGDQLPYIDRLVTLIVPDSNTTTLKFLSGETDVLGVQQSDYKTIKAQEDKGNFEVYNLGPTTSTHFLGFNLNMRSKPAKENPELFKLFNETRFRQAVSHAINREQIARNVYDGLGQPGYGPESPANKLFYSPDVPKFEYNLTKAKQMLQDLGLKDSNGDGILEMKNGKPVKFNIITNVENKLRVGTATIITNDLRKIGLDASFTPISFPTLISRVDNQIEPGKPYPPYDWQAMILGFTGGVEPHNGVNIWNSGGNLHQWEPYQEKPVRPWEAEIDRLFREGAQEMDETKRRAIYADFQKLVGEQQPYIYTVVPDAIVALRNKYGNVKPCSSGRRDLESGRDVR